MAGQGFCHHVIHCWPKTAQLKPQQGQVKGKKDRSQQSNVSDKCITLFVISSTPPRPCMCSGPNIETSFFPSENTEPMSLKVSGQTPLESVLSFPHSFSNALFDHIPRNLPVSLLPPSTHHLRRSPLPSHQLPLFPGKHSGSDFCRHQTTPGSAENGSYSEPGGTHTCPSPAG